MNKLFIELYLDENVPVLVAKILRARGFNVLTVSEAGTRGASDPDQLAYAVERGLAIVSINRVDFEVLAIDYFQAGSEHFGIFLIADNSPQMMAQRLNVFLDTYTADEMMNQVVYL